MDPGPTGLRSNGSSRTTRREALGAGLGALSAAVLAPGWLSRRAAGATLPSNLQVRLGSSSGARRGETGLDPADPVFALREGSLGSSVMVHGLPFRSQWHGDWFGPGTLPFHSPQVGDALGIDEEVDVAIIGGGLSGLATGALLALRDPTVNVAMFDMRTRLGGNAIGESWRGIPYSLGSAYFMVPDSGTLEDGLYSELGIYDDARIDEGGGFRLEYADQVVDDLCADCSPEERTALAAYRRMVDTYANETYPDIPLDPASEPMVLKLDQYTLKDHVESTVGGPLPPLVADAVQAYCYSSFGVGWEILNAAAGWNFLAAEEFGRIVLPGGNAGLAQRLWGAMRAAERRRLRGAPIGVNALPLARLSARVIDVRLEAGSRAVRVTWNDRFGRTRVTRAQHAVHAGSKFLARHIMPELATYDEAKEYATHQVPTVAYLVANVLLRRPAPRDFYDIFLVHDAQFPAFGPDMEFDRRITDVLAGSYTNGPTADADVLTLYWPLPWHTARFTAVKDADWRTYAQLGAEQIHRVLALLGLTAGDVEQVRIARWGHAMPFMEPGFLAAGYGEALRRPIDGRIHFVNQDNWALPAWENSLADADSAVTEILG